MRIDGLLDGPSDKTSDGLSDTFCKGIPVGKYVGSAVLGVGRLVGDTILIFMFMLTMSSSSFFNLRLSRRFDARWVPFNRASVVRRGNRTRRRRRTTAFMVCGLWFML